jgi:hypothetical protein
VIVQSPDPTYKVTEYDFQFSSSHFVQMTIDHRYDTIFFYPDEIRANFGAKKKGGREIEAEDVVILKHHLLTYSFKERELIDTSAVEDDSWTSSATKH